MVNLSSNKRKKSAVDLLTECIIGELFISNILMTVTAMLRRGVAYQGKQEFIKAAKDIKCVADQEPNNKRAADILKELEKSIAEQKAKGRRMVIEEVEGSDSEDSDSLSNVQVADTTPTKHVNGHSEELKNKVLNLTQGKTGDDKSANVHVIQSPSVEEDKSDGSDIFAAQNDEAPNEQAREPAQVELPQTDSVVESSEKESEPKKSEPVATPAPVVTLSDLPADVSALKESGNNMFRNGQYAEAIEMYDKAIKKLPGLSLILV